MLLGELPTAIDALKTILILPAVSVGNVGQLAVDLLITNLKLEYLCQVDGHDCTLPMVGNDPFGGDNLCTSLTAYSCHREDLNILVFQQRSDFLRERKKEYFHRLSTWLKQCRFRAVFVLASAFAHERTDEQMTKSPLQYRLTPDADKFFSDFEIAEDKCGAYKSAWPMSRNQEDGRQERILPGSGISQALFEYCLDANLPLIVVSKYCSEGDNKMDSCQVASVAAKLLGLPVVPQKWTIPKSWRVQGDV